MSLKMLERGADYNDAMAMAALNGHLNIVELMLEKGADNYNEAMTNAAAAANELGANDFNMAMEVA